MLKKLEKAIRTAAIFHAGQFDKSGQPYILHCLAVMNMLISLGVDDEDTLCAAVMHDILEDTKYSREHMKIAFGWNVTRTVQRLTKREGEVYSDYLERVSLEKPAILIKMADLRHNSDLTRLKGVTEKDFLRTQKYMRAYNLLKEKLNEMDTSKSSTD